MPQCQGITKKGEQCRQWGREVSGFCLMHDPDRTREAARAQVKGALKANKGKERYAKPEDIPCGPPETAEEAQRWSSWLVFALATGQITPNVGGKVSTALNTFRLTHDYAEMVAEIRLLKAQVKEIKDAD